jgi:uncharacterized protein YdeI (YjbR/CyaY-like superfamily)
MKKEKTSTEQKFFPNRNSFRRWLERNHTRENGIWMLYYKIKEKRCITYREALEEALCYGWIDSTIRRIDEETYVRKFTPRKDKSNWSDLNKSLVLSLLKKGKMTEAGLKKIDVYLSTGRVDWDPESLKKEEKKQPVPIPDFILDTFRENQPALTHFNAMAPSHQRQYVLWITSAKREETIAARLREAADLLKQNMKPGLR